MVDDDVLKFDVSVGHVSLVQVSQNAEKLLHYSDRFILRELAVGRGFEVGVEALTLDEFHDKVHRSRAVDRFEKLADVWVVEP